MNLCQIFKIILIENNPLSSYREYSLTGAYRKVFETAADLTWQFVKYNSDQDMLLITDYEEVLKKNPVEIHENGPLTACLLEFKLNSSTYATMVLREIMKVDTSTENQIKLAKGNSIIAYTYAYTSAEVEEPDEKKVKAEDLSLPKGTPESVSTD